jgi:hypothetical protein
VGQLRSWFDILKKNMKRVFLAIACVIVASPVFAQEVDLGLGGDASSLLNLPAPRGNTPAPGNVPAPGDARGRVKLTLENAGAPFSAEQIAQIQPLFDEQNQAKLQLLKESQGQPPDKAKIDQLQRETLAKVIRLLTPSQRAALAAK